MASYYGRPVASVMTPGGAPGTTSGGSGSLPFDYNAPKWDETAIESLTQRKATTGLRELRRQMQTLQGKAFASDSPQVRRMTLREALQGYGVGVEKVMSGASEAATSEYGRRYAFDVDAAKTKFTTLYDKWKTEKTLSTQKEIARFRDSNAYNPMDNPMVKNAYEESLYRGYNKQNW